MSKIIVSSYALLSVVSPFSINDEKDSVTVSCISGTLRIGYLKTLNVHSDKDFTTEICAMIIPQLTKFLKTLSDQPLTIKFYSFSTLEIGPVLI